MNARRRAFGQVVILAALALMAAYATVTAAGFAALRAPGEPIPDPYFTVMEALILALAPVLILVMVVVHAWAAPARKRFAFAAIVFMAITAALTSIVHVAVLTLSRAPAFAAYARWLEFRWPSPVYALDILAWDVFFALSVGCAAFVFDGGGAAAWVRRLFVVSSVLSAAGLLGVVLSDMMVRNIGIVGYAIVFPAGVACFAWVLRRQDV
ncbi:MAG: hypothetical protein JNL81_10600 [Hyphomonadaceae bacterium]|nr:hypothetical protein [Hyphomonadaceae bacterium]